MNKINSQKGFVIPLVIAIVVILIGGGIYLSTKKDTTKNVEVVTDTNSTSTQSTVGWINHEVKSQDKLLSFSVQAPSDWKWQEGPDGKYSSWNLINQSNHSSLNIYWPVESCTDSEWKLLRADLYPSREKCINVGEVMFHLVLTAATSSDEFVLEQIASTFKFTEKTSNADWKTYTNSEYGVEFQYPKSWLIGVELSEKNNPSYGHFTCFNPQQPSGDCKDALLIISSKATNDHMELLKDVYSKSYPLSKTWMKNDVLYFFAVTETNKEIFDQIITTFKFTN